MNPASVFRTFVGMKRFFLLLSLLLSHLLFAQEFQPGTRAADWCATGHMRDLSLRPVTTFSHAALMNQYDVKFYWLDLKMERNTKYLDGKVTMRATSIVAIDSFGFELHTSLTIDSVKVNGITRTVYRNVNESAALLGAGFPANTSLNVEIWYHGLPTAVGGAAIGSGISTGTSGSWGNQVTWTLSEPYSAYEWWPCKQSLTDKADSSWVFVTTDVTNKVGSNGLLTAITPMGGGKHRYEWKSSHAIDYYLISVTIAKYVEYNIWAHPAGYPDSILVQNYIYDNPSTLPYFKADIDRTPELIELFSERYGLYFFADEKYGHAMAPFSGGMEHQTMTSLGFFNFDLIAHELAHQWFGDNVTCRTWNDIWVNEGFASYSEYVANEFLNPGDEVAWMQSTHDNVMSQPGGSVFCTDTTNVSRIFSGRLTYDKGAAIIHMIRHEVNNDSLFWLALQTYQQQYRDSTASGVQFQHVVETVTGVDLDNFMADWYFGEGYPTYDVEWAHVGGLFYVETTESSSTGVTPFHRNTVTYTLHRSSGGDTLVRVLHTGTTTYFSLPVSGTVTSIEVDKENWVLNQVGSITQDLTIGQDQPISEQQPQVWPVPAHDQLHLRTEADGYVHLYDLHGRLVLSTQLQAGIHTLSLEGLASGVYLLHLPTATGFAHRQVVVE